MGTLYCIRHAQASFGSDNYDKLSDLGHVQSRHTGDWFARLGIRPDRVLTGGQVRHQETLDGIVLPVGGRPFSADPAFAEFDFHDVLVKSDPDYRNRVAELMKADRDTANRTFQGLYVKAIDRWISGAFDTDYAIAWPDFRHRVETGLMALCASLGPRETVVLVTSGGPLTAMVAALSGGTAKSAFDVGYRLYNAGITRIETMPEGGPVLVGLNAVAHLEIHKEPSLLTFR